MTVTALAVLSAMATAATTEIAAAVRWYHVTHSVHYAVTMVLLQRGISHIVQLRELREGLETSSRMRH